MHHFVPWQDRARCREYDPEIFFPEKGGSSREAKRICAECPVRIECLNYALRRDERYGVWGGMSERERRRLKRMASLPPGSLDRTDTGVSPPSSVSHLPRPGRPPTGGRT